MEFWVDPLKDDGKELEVYDLASANHAAKIANELHFSIYYMGQNMLKELNRMGAENFDRQVALIKPYITSSDTSTATTSEGFPIEPTITSIPNPLPPTVPQSVRNAINYLNTQFEIEERRMNAELAADTEQLRETLERMESKLSNWFKKQIGVKWLAGKREVILSGTRITYSGGDTDFEFYEMEYD